jgi:hypothetical protein
MSSFFPVVLAFSLASIPAPPSARVDGPILFERLSIADAHKLASQQRRFIIAISTPTEPLGASYAPA